MRSTAFMAGVAISCVLSLTPLPRVVAQDQGNVADGILPGGNILSVSALSDR